MSTVVEIRGKSIGHHERGDAGRVPVTSCGHFEGEVGLNDGSHTVEQGNRVEKSAVWGFENP